MKRAILLGFLVLLPLGRDAAAGGFEVRGGAFFPRAESDLFTDDQELYTVDKSDWIGFTGGVGFDARLARNLEIAFDIDGYERRLNTSYRDFTRENDSEIQQSLRLELVPVGVSLRLIPGGRRGHLAPYLSAGVDIIFYRYTERGDFIDFFDDNRPIRADSFRSEGVAPGFHVAGGLRVPVGDDWSVVGEVKYQFAKTDMNDDFRNSRLDLGGASATIGAHLRF